MDKRAAFQGDYVDLRFVKSRKVCQVVIEIPIEAGSAFVAAFGTPDPSKGVPVAIARLAPQSAEKPKAEREHHSWHELSPAQQAGIRCADKVFGQFLIDRHGHHCEADPADTVRAFCGIKSRTELNTSIAAREKWERLNDEFIIWQRYPELAA
jgi:hypothetical protein